MEGKAHKPKAFRLRGNESDHYESLKTRTARKLKVESLTETEFIRLMVDYCFRDLIGDFPHRDKVRSILSERKQTESQNEDQKPDQV